MYQFQMAVEGCHTQHAEDNKNETSSNDKQGNVITQTGLSRILAKTWVIQGIICRVTHGLVSFSDMLRYISFYMGSSEIQSW